MVTTNSYIQLLRCPDCEEGGLAVSHPPARALVCKACAAVYPLADDRPVLLRHDNALFSIGAYGRAKVTAGSGRVMAGRWVPSPSVNLASERVLGQLRARLDAAPTPATVLVVGGGSQREWLDPRLRASAERLVIYTDIDAGADVELFCDGHDLPFKDSSFDAVVTTAVLEHVIYPERVAAEITRVLKPGGLLYSELPFMQQVHEGAYDFTRYTLSGHRRLFNGFAAIEAGMVAGPATALVWCIENFVLAFVTRPLSRKIAKTLVRIAFAWLKYFDFLLAKRPEAMDGASCTFLFGQKAATHIPDAEIISGYVGAKHLRHT